VVFADVVPCMDPSTRHGGCSTPGLSLVLGKRHEFSRRPVAAHDMVSDASPSFRQVERRTAGWW